MKFLNLGSLNEINYPCACSASIILCLIRRITMEKSIFGSAIKTYPSKRNRFSSYRPSCLVFKDDDPFDQLIKDEENKKPLTVKKSGVERGVVRSTKSYFPSNYGAPVLKNIQNYSCVNRKSSILPHTKKK